MINLIFNEKAKKLGAKWNGREWVPPKLAQTEFNELEKYYYDEQLIVEVSAGFEEREWIYSRVLLVHGYIIATVNGRDNGAKMSDNVSVITGWMDSGGSRKNPRIIYSKELTVRMLVSKSVYHEMLNDSDYTIKLIDTDQDSQQQKIQDCINFLQLNGYQVINKATE